MYQPFLWLYLKIILCCWPGHLSFGCPALTASCGSSYEVYVSGSSIATLKHLGLLCRLNLIELTLMSTGSECLIFSLRKCVLVTHLIFLFFVTH